MSSLQFSKTNEFLAAGLAEGTVKVWDLIGSKQVTRIFTPSAGKAAPVTHVSFTKANDLVGASTSAGQVLIYPIADLIASGSTGKLSKVNELVALSAPSPQSVNSFSFSPHLSTQLALCQEDGSVSLMDYERGTVACRYKEHISGARELAHSPLSKVLLVSVGSDRQIVFYDIGSKQKIQAVSCADALHSMSINSDGYTLAVGTAGKAKVLIFDLRQVQNGPFAVLSGHGSTVNSLQFRHADPVTPVPQHQ